MCVCVCVCVCVWVCESVSEKDFVLDAERSLLAIVIYEDLWFEVAQGRMNGTPNETRVGLQV